MSLSWEETTKTLIYHHTDGNDEVNIVKCDYKYMCTCVIVEDGYKQVPDRSFENFTSL